MEAFTRAGAFLCSLFVVLLRSLQAIDAEMDHISQLYGVQRPQSLESIFRLLMTVGQSFSRRGQPCRQFYDHVLEFADEVCGSYFHLRTRPDVLLLPDVVAAVTLDTSW
jgi:hypothetical protein